MDRESRKQLIADQLAAMQFWRIYLFVMYGLHYILGVAAVGLSVTVASKPFGITAGTAGDLAWGLAFVTGLIGFINPERIGDRYQRAFQTLSVVVTKYLADDSYTVDDVVKAYEAGEAIIHQKRASE